MQSWPTLDQTNFGYLQVYHFATLKLCYSVRDQQN